MHLRVTRVQRKGKTYEYAQLVESYRRESDGMPMHRVIAGLGTLSQTELDNLRTALKASRDDKRVVVARSATPAPRAAPAILANLRYLDLAVLLALWNEWELPALLGELKMSKTSAAVVAALALQRCSDPGSKLSATRWFPQSALPELLGISPAEFNNTRLHRVLDELDSAGPRLMADLPRKYAAKDGAFVSLFLDVTDTWFVGNGPELAARGKTKEGLVQQKIGIVLLCNERGYPLRWEVVSGASADCTVMTAMLRSIAGLKWVGDAPVVCDRAMGHTAQLVEMTNLGMRFLTAVTVTEMGTYAEKLPHDALSAVVADTSWDPERQRSEAQAAAKAVEAAGMQRVDDDLLVLDLGSVERTVETAARAERAPESTLQEAMRLAQELAKDVDDHRFPSQAAAARERGLTRSLASKYCKLGALPIDVQSEILGGGAAGKPIAQLLAIAALPDADQQREAFRALAGPVSSKNVMEDGEAVLAPREQPPAPQQTPGQTSPGKPPDTKLKLRVVAYFNPERFVEQRLCAKRHLEEIETFVKDLNSSLASSRSRLTKVTAAAAVDRQLRKHNLVDAFSLTVSEKEIAGRTHFSVAAVLDAEVWTCRRRYDGFSVLVGHPSLPQGPVDLCRLYRAKDKVEKDFQTVKSVVELRPIRHRTDNKVRAHVTICMLALLLERTLEHKLGDRTAEAALETLRTCLLNHYRSHGDETAYVLTEPSAQQHAILRSLKLPQLVAQEDVAERLFPR